MLPQSKSKSFAVVFFIVVSPIRTSKGSCSLVVLDSGDKLDCEFSATLHTDNCKGLGRLLFRIVQGKGRQLRQFDRVQTHGFDDLK